MELQKTFTTAYAKQLQLNVDENLRKYALDSFEIDSSQVLFVHGLPHPDGLLEKMVNAQNDAEAAKALYEAYRTLTPLQATIETFWIYLAHTELFPYVQKRWKKVKEENCKEDYISDHWFFKHGLIRNALSGLWWSVYCTIDEDNMDYPYIYTDFLLSYYTMRVVRLGSSKLMRHKEAVFGIIQYLIDTKDAEDTENTMEDRVNFVTSHFNKMGASKQLAYLDRNFFYEELKKVNHELLHFHQKKTGAEEEIEEE